MSTPGEARAIAVKAEECARNAWRAVTPVERLELRGIVPDLVTALDAVARATALHDQAQREAERRLADTVAAVERAIGRA